MNDYNINNPPEALRKRLHANEKVLWIGKPYTGLAFIPQDVVFIPLFSVPMFWAVISITVSLLKQLPQYNWQSPDTWATALLIIFILAFLTWFSFGRFIHDIYIRKKMIYAITNRNIHFVPQLWGMLPRRLPLKNFIPILTGNPSNRGTINFQHIKGNSALSSYFSKPLTTQIGYPHRFYKIENADEVYELILKTKENPAFI